MRYTLSCAKKRHLRRSLRARSIDNVRRNKHIIRRSQRSRLSLWFRHPERYDIIGIDYPRSHKRRVHRVYHRTHYKKPMRKFKLFVRQHRPGRRINRRMNTGLQLFNLRKLMRKHEVPHDAFDVRSHIDRTLRYPENRREIEPRIRILSPKKDEEKHSRVWHEDAYGIY